MNNQARFTLNADQALIMVIDIQERLVSAMPTADKLVRNTATLLHMAQAYRLPVAVSEQYPKGLGRTVEPLSLLLDEAFFRIEKTAYNAASPEFLSALSASGRRQILLAGIETHICVFQTARTLLDNGYDVFIPLDAVGSRSRTNWKNGLELLSAMGAVITNTETVLFDLMKDAKDPHFKALQALIK